MSPNEAPLVHLSMVYACDAGHERRIYCEVGVEGPPELRADEQAWKEHRIIPSPFMGPPCPVCMLGTHHARWSEDEEFTPPVPAPPGATVFTHPGQKKVRKREQRHGGSVFLGDTVRVPGGAT